MTVVLPTSLVQPMVNEGDVGPVPLASVCDVIMGQAPAGDTYNTLGNGVPLIAGAGDFSDGVLTPKKFTDKPTKLSEPGDIVLSIRASIGDKVWADKVYCLGRGVAALRARPSVDANYLWHWVSASSRALMSKARGATFLQVNRSDIAGLPIVVPPLAEQRRIAAILDKADELRIQRRQALAHLDTLTQSIFHSMFGDVNQTYISIGDACSLITDGTHQTPTYSSAGVKFLSAKNVTSGRIDWTSIKFIPQELHAQLHKRLAPRRGDILLAKNGTTGVCAVVDTDEVFDIYVSLALLRPTVGFNSCFLHAAINSPEAKRQFNAHLKGIGVSNLHLKDIRTTRIPGPELPLQQAFARRISAVERAKDCHRAQLTELDALIASLQHRAFSVQP